MISKENYMGKISISDEYITNIIKNTVSDCFGVAGLVSTGLDEAIEAKITGSDRNSGISVRIRDDRLAVRIHISVTFGTNIPAVAESLRNKLRFALSESVGVELERVDIFVDEIVS
ncbi:MAG: Asp23/Gls24 family envelope stress response protein [Porcipelethomonas sp.]